MFGLNSKMLRSRLILPCLAIITGLAISIFATSPPTDANASPPAHTDGTVIKSGIDEYSETAEKRPVDKSVTRLSSKKGSKSTTDHSKLKELQRPV